MKYKIIFVSCWLSITAGSSLFSQGKHLFILSGQSNMVRLNVEESFQPILEETFGTEHIIIVKDAMGSQPIRRWYVGNESNENPDLYHRLIKKVTTPIKDKTLASITFVWMQGERDAREALGDIYEANFTGLYNQLCNDLNTKQINVVIGRLNDFDMNNNSYLHWTKIRAVQEQLANSNPRFEWVNTDDLNDGFDREGKAIENDLHLSAEGYMVLGKRFAEKAIILIEKFK
ncbi:sialate O-acetylesterase [Paucihalobacter ruber]|uniref:Sialate O-acetylesterase n=1 Tax=Paucihalobacter ruber TaxID=2567861 RepID=A0A506PPG3_9FLAO|nr:sialate O-acetylesterase [Paucihalobacter ruber]TPV35468.1 sialate O-acetylesterase [Paucihalobacter ruber]